MYPIHRLNYNITRIFRDIVSADIEGDINKGLQNEIHFIDEDSHITDVARITGNRLDNTCQVSLSSAYCQFLWLICDIFLKEIDFNIIKEECLKAKIPLNEYKEYLSRYLASPQARIGIKLQLTPYPNINPDSFYDYLQRMVSLIDEKEFHQHQDKESDLAISLKDTSKPIDFEGLNNLKMDGPYEVLSNSAYCFGIAFILLHELSHFDLGHLNSADEKKEDEESADFVAFWDLYNDIDETREFSANIGIICALYSLILINPMMEEDDVHPREDKRLFSVYDIIKGDNPKYTFLVKKLFDYWGKIFGIKNYPFGLSDDENGLDQIRKFLDSNNWK